MSNKEKSSMSGPGNRNRLSFVGIDSAMSRSQRPHATGTSYREPPIRGFRLLLVDDSFVYRTLLKGLLEQRQHNVTLAVNGADAVNAVRDQVFDVILMDVEMPTMDGLEATRQIREWESSTNRRTPIIGMTTIDRKTCLQADMDDHLPKSRIRQDLDAILARHTRGSGGPSRFMLSPIDSFS